jgi:gamma-glutamylcyclotransferase (GGCT)/AIG2-like uncharacterized protein YtfP
VLERDSLLFVYGTLREFVDIPMARRLRSVARYVGTARAPGRLYDLGRYPGLKPALRRGEWVSGDLYLLPAPRALLRDLDRYEAGVRGRERARFVRVRTPLLLARSRRTVAWVYLFTRPVRAAARIPRGDYRRHLDEGDRSALD